MATKDKTGAAASEWLVCRNARALRDYDIEQRLEVGLALQGSEVKSLRARRASLDGAYATVDGMELFLHKMHIAPYEHANVFGHEPKRTRKLLAHKREIERLAGKVAQRGYTLVPLRVYFKNGRAKVELGFARGRTKGDRRESIKSKIAQREARAAMGKGRKR